MIIGLAGIKRSGKNTVAGYIAERYDDYNVTEWSFARDLKISAARSLGFEGTDDECVLFCDKLKEDGHIIVGEQYYMDWKISGRQFLQNYGTEAHREVFGPNFWINNLLQKIYDIEDGELYHVDNPKPRLDIITDVRFPNEAEAIRGKSVGGKVIQVRRPEVEYDLDNHASEKPLDESLIDGVIWNDYDLDVLKQETYLVMQEVCKDYFIQTISKRVPYA